MSEETTALSKIELAEKHLSPRELAAYRFWASASQPRLSPTLQNELFESFLQGRSLEEIVRFNKGLSLAQVAFASVDGNWHEIRSQYLSDLFNSTRSIVQQSTLESVRFLVDLLAVVNKKFGTAAKLYLQTGDEKHLKGFEIGSIGQYGKVVEILQKLMGVDHEPKKTEQKVSGEIVHKHQVEETVKTIDAASLIRSQLGS